VKAKYRNRSNCISEHDLRRALSTTQPRIHNLVENFKSKNQSEVYLAVCFVLLMLNLNKIWCIIVTQLRIKGGVDWATARYPQHLGGSNSYKLIKSVICEQYTIRCKRYHRQLELISRRSVLTHWNCFVDAKAVDSLARLVWPTLTNKLVLQSLTN